MAFIPIPIVIHKTQQQTSCSTFVPSYSGGYLNLGFASECDIYRSGGSYWIRFLINGNIKYYAHSFEKKEDAEQELIKILKQ